MTNPQQAAGEYRLNFNNPKMEKSMFTENGNAELDLISQQPEVFSDAELKKAGKQLDTAITRGRKSFDTRVMSISPELASLMLQRNPADENRKISSKKVSEYASDMRKGLWVGLNGQTIVMSSDGYLNDGQHRLSAVIEYGKPVEMLVSFGADRQSRLTLDQNKVRTSGNYLEMLGVKNANNVAAAAKILMAIETNNVATSKGRLGILGKRGQPTKREIHEFTMSRLDDLTKTFDWFGYKWKEFPCSPSSLVAARIILRSQTKDHEAVDSFLTQIAWGEGITRTSPAYHARSRILTEGMAGNSRAALILEIIFRAWNGMRDRGRMTRLVLRGELPEISV